MKFQDTKNEFCVSIIENCEKLNADMLAKFNKVDLSGAKYLDFKHSAVYGELFVGDEHGLLTLESICLFNNQEPLFYFDKGIVYKLSDVPIWETIRIYQEIENGCFGKVLQKYFKD